MVVAHEWQRWWQRRVAAVVMVVVVVVVGVMNHDWWARKTRISGKKTLSDRSDRWAYSTLTPFPYDSGALRSLRFRGLTALSFRGPFPLRSGSGKGAQLRSVRIPKQTLLLFADD
jgi:hypothetical protein